LTIPPTITEVDSADVSELLSKFQLGQTNTASDDSLLLSLKPSLLLESELKAGIDTDDIPTPKRNKIELLGKRLVLTHEYSLNLICQTSYTHHNPMNNMINGSYLFYPPYKVDVTNEFITEIKISSWCEVI
jgi:hypothetical protein